MHFSCFETLDMLFAEMPRQSGFLKHKVFKTTNSKDSNDLPRMSVVVMGKPRHLVSEVVCVALKVRTFNVARISSW